MEIRLSCLRVRANKYNKVKNPNWPEANQLVIYKRDRGFELGTTKNKTS